MCIYHFLRQLFLLVTPSGVTECTQLENICNTYSGTYDGPNGNGDNTICGCTGAQQLADCFEENKLYVEGSLPVSMTLDQCLEACQSVTTCEVKRKLKSRPFGLFPVFQHE